MPDCIYSLIALPTPATSERTPKESILHAVAVSCRSNDGKFEEICGTSSNFDVLFHVAGVVREAIHYIKDERKGSSPANSYNVAESRLRSVCYALIRAAGPNSFMFCDSIALALRYVQLLSLTFDTNIKPDAHKLPI